MVFDVRMASSNRPIAISARADLERVRQSSQLLYVRNRQVNPVRLELQQDLPVGVVEPGRPIGLRERETAVIPQLLGRQLAKRHRQQFFSPLEVLLVKKELLLLHEAPEVAVDRIAGIHLLELRQQKIPQRGRRRPRRRHSEADQSLGFRRGLSRPQGAKEHNEGAAEHGSHHGMTPGE